MLNISQTVNPKTLPEGRRNVGYVMENGGELRPIIDQKLQIAEIFNIDCEYF